MIVAGCDVGSLTAEAVIMSGEEILAAEIIGVRPKPEQSARDVMERALEKAHLTLKDIDYCVSTGYGREKIPFARDNVSEISCHGKGAHWLVPSVRTVIDVGGQDCKVIRVDAAGKLQNFIMNDKCAAGTGRFLEVMAKTLGVRLEEIGPLSLLAKNPVVITSMCSIYAQTEVAAFIAEEADRHDLAAGITRAMAERVKSLAMRVGVEEDVVITGGVAKNIGVVKSLEGMLRVSTKKLSVDPQIVGALGGALFAREKIAPEGQEKKR
jgi:predicted CoA-substrate-specific enzyme activase